MRRFTFAPYNLCYNLKSKETGLIRGDGKWGELEDRRLRSAISRLESYRSANMLPDVHAALAAKNCSSSTIRSWLKDPSKIAHGYKRNDFIEAMLGLQDLQKERRDDAYKFALEEMGLLREGQQDLVGYDGRYAVVHDFGEDLGLDQLHISVEKDPFTVTFIFRYGGFAKSESRENRLPRRECDGLIVLRHGRLMWVGLSRTTVFLAAFGTIGYPEANFVSGMAFIEDTHLREIRISRVVIVPYREFTRSYEERAKEYVRGSGLKL